MNPSPNLPPNPQESPDEAHIEALLRGIKPLPGQHFHQRMADAPWNHAKRRFGSHISRWSLVSATALLILALTFLSLLVLPSFQVLAQQIRLFFWHTSSDQLELTTLPPGTLIPSAASETPPALLSIQAVQDQVGFTLLTPQSLPDGLSFQGASYNPMLQAVTLRYTAINHTLLITQRPSGEIQEYSTIGASAPVESVKVRGVEAELVSGGWLVATPMPETGTSTLPENVIWDSQLDQHILRWQESGMIYEILSSGGGYLTRQELVRLAESLK